MVGVEFSNLEPRLVFFKKLLLFNLFKEDKRLNIISCVELSIISTIEVANSKFSISRMYWKRAFHGVSIVIVSIMSAIFVVRLSLNKSLKFGISFTGPSFQAFNFSTDKDICNNSSVF